MKLPTLRRKASSQVGRVSLKHLLTRGESGDLHQRRVCCSALSLCGRGHRGNLNVPCWARGCGPLTRQSSRYTPKSKPGKAIGNESTKGFGQGHSAHLGRRRVSPLPEPQVGRKQAD